MPETLTWTLADGEVALIYTNPVGMPIMLLHFHETEGFDSFVKNTLEFQRDIKAFNNRDIPAVFLDKEDK